MEQFDFIKEFGLLKEALQESDFNAISNGLLIMKTKQVLVRKHGLNTALDNFIDRVAKEQEQMKINFLLKCKEAGMTEQDLEKKALEMSA